MAAREPRLVRAELQRGPGLRLIRAHDATGADDASIVRGLIAREEWAARAAWSRHAPAVYRLFDRALGSAGESEDLTQDVFLRIFAGIRRLRDPDAFGSFIYSSAIRMLRWHLRKKKVRRIFQLSSSDVMPDRATPAADSEGRELLERFYRILDVMKAEDRVAYVLRNVEGMSLDEVARTTGVSLATVKRRIRRASTGVLKLAKADPDLVEYLIFGGDDDDT